jgi:hypothetical protein
MLTHTELLEAELKWLEKVIKVRIEYPKEDLRGFDILKIAPDKNKFGPITDAGDYNLIPAAIENTSSKYGTLAAGMSFEERLLLILALHHHLNPGFIEMQLSKHAFKSLIEKDPTIYHSAGLSLRDDFGILPTGRFYIYLMGGRNLSLTSEILIKIHKKELSPIRLGLVGIVNDGITERLYSGRLVMLEADIYELITNQSYKEIATIVENS